MSYGTEVPIPPAPNAVGDGGAGSTLGPAKPRKASSGPKDAQSRRGSATRTNSSRKGGER